MEIKKRLLVVDDEENIRELLKLEFTDLDYEVIVMESAFNALNYLKDHQIDLVILDIKMPGMDGIEALEKIISTQRGMPVVIHSAYSHYKENYLTWSAAAYVVKSGELEELINTVETLIREQG
ncbi:MAG: two-component system response regulator [SAR324 cluster bacterium]|uniref:Two-component system response regulator n=1 Tax=SAR324 cluster bacterium TaxID=2024889 RepID=A0A2A4T348_9DELT|nr:MAG: two-component system response regulator [SAR324 cluster bacterium]